MKTLYKLHFECGRQGTLTGIFIEDSGRMKKLVESEEEVYFGEVLGKHSEICGPLDNCDFTEVSNDPEVLKIIEEHDLTNIDSPVRT